MIVRSRGEARGEHGGGDAREAKVDPTRPSHVSASGGRESQPDPVTRGHGRCGTGMLYLLVRTEKGWKITKRLELWVS